MPLQAFAYHHRGDIPECFNSTMRGYTLPAFTFEKIPPPVRRGPLPPIVKKQRGLVTLILDRFVAVRVKRSHRDEPDGRPRGPQDVSD
jgi:hypothetical protein